MDPEKLTENVPSGVQKRTLKGLYGRIRQVEGHVDRAYQGLNKAVEEKIAALVNTVKIDLYAMLKERDEKISKLESEIATVRNTLNAALVVTVGGPTSEPAVETPDRGVQPA